jgi:hypothetical protein
VKYKGWCPRPRTRSLPPQVRRGAEGPSEHTIVDNRHAPLSREDEMQLVKLHHIPPNFLLDPHPSLRGSLTEQDLGASMYDARCHPSRSIPGSDISLCPSCLCTVEWVRLADVLGEVYALGFHCDYPKTTFLQLRLPDPTTYHIPQTSFHQVSSFRTQNPSLPRQYTSEDSLVSATGDRRPVPRRFIPTTSLDPRSHDLIHQVQVASTPLPQDELLQLGSSDRRGFLLGLLPQVLAQNLA